jgi:hypothetical protein
LEYKIKKIKWLDSYGCTNSWRPIEKITEKLICETIGYVISETDELISLANSISYETEETIEQANGVMTIPKVSIIEEMEI